MPWLDPDSRPEADPDAQLQRLLEIEDAVRARALEPGAEVAPPAATGLATFLRFTHGREGRTETRALESPWLVVVLAGSMSVRTSGSATRADTGEVVILPGRTSLELAFRPAGGEAFHALEVELLAESLVRWLPVELALEPHAGAGLPALRRPGRAALAALVSFCEGVLEPTTHRRVLEHQLEGVLLALSLEARADPSAVNRERAQLDLTLAIRQLVRANPDSPWSLPGMARRMGLSAATLRRRLAQRGTGLRRLVQQERMLVARTLLGDGRLNVTEVALRCGYGSPAKFSRQFRQSFGVVPSQYRAGERPGELH